MATAAAPAKAKTSSRTAPSLAVASEYREALRVGWAVRNRAGQVVVIYEGVSAQTAAQEWADDRSYTIEAVTL